MHERTCYTNTEGKLMARLTEFQRQHGSGTVRRRRQARVGAGDRSAARGARGGVVREGARCMDACEVPRARGACQGGLNTKVRRRSHGSTDGRAPTRWCTARRNVTAPQLIYLRLTKRFSKISNQTIQTVNMKIVEHL
jgi:hypothetical protein